MKEGLKKKYKKVKYQHLKKLYEKKLSKLPQNCKYNKAIKLPNRSVINICSFNLDDSFEVDLCYKPEHSKECNAFCFIRTKEQIYEDFLRDIKDDVTCATEYKDIAILHWLEPELLYEDETLPWYKSFYLKVLKFFRDI